MYGARELQGQDMRRKTNSETARTRGVERKGDGSIHPASSKSSDPATLPSWAKNKELYAMADSLLY